MCFTVTIIYLVIGTIFLCTRGFNLGIDFRAGSDVTLKADNIHVEYIHTDDDVSWNGQALSFFKDLLKENIKAYSMDLLEKKEFRHYEFLVYKIDEKYILNVIYIYEINKEVFIVDQKGNLYENLLKNFDKNYIYKFEKNKTDFIDLNFSLVKNNAMKSYFALHSGD